MSHTRFSPKATSTKQIDLLKELLERQLAKHGKDDWSVQQLQQQISALEYPKTGGREAQQKVFGMTFGQPRRK